MEHTERGAGSGESVMSEDEVTETLDSLHQNWEEREGEKERGREGERERGREGEREREEGKRNAEH